MSDLQDRLVECVTRQDTDVHAMQKRFSERDRLHDDLEQRTTEQIGSLAEELNKRIVSVETKISDETNSAVMAIEAVTLTTSLGPPKIFILFTVS